MKSKVIYVNFNSKNKVTKNPISRNLFRLIINKVKRFFNHNSSKSNIIEFYNKNNIV